jgi:hypothetical protein
MLIQLSGILMSSVALRSFAVRRLRGAVTTILLLAGAACSHDDSTAPAPGFLGGTSDDHEIGVVVNSTGNALTLFQLGSPATQKQIPLGSSSTVSPTGISIAGRRAAVPLGDAASVALINLETEQIARFFTFASGNATGSAWVDDSTIVAANLFTNVLGRMRVGQPGDAITQTVPVDDSPTAIAVADGRIMVVCGNLQGEFPATHKGLITIIDAKTFTVLGSVSTDDFNPVDAAVGPDGLLYVVNAVDFASSGSLSIIDPATRQLVQKIDDIGVGPGAITIDEKGLAYISGFSLGTLVWNTRTRAFVRGPTDPVCAKLGTTTECRGAFAAATSADGSLYQLFFGDQTHAPYAFVYAPNSFALRDSIAVGSGPAAIEIRTF